MLHVQDVLLGAHGGRARAAGTAGIFNPLQDAVNVLQAILLRVPNDTHHHTEQSTAKSTFTKSKFLYHVAFLKDSPIRTPRSAGTVRTKERCVIRWTVRATDQEGTQSLQCFRCLLENGQHRRLQAFGI